MVHYVIKSKTFHNLGKRDHDYNAGKKNLFDLLIFFSIVEWIEINLVHFSYYYFEKEWKNADLNILKFMIEYCIWGVTMGLL